MDKKILHLWPILIVNLFFAVLFWVLLDTHLLKEISGSLHSFGSTWGDLPWHMSIIMGVVERGWDALRTDPVYAGTKLSYPFLPEVLTALFVKMGMSLRASLMLTTWPALVALTATISYVTYRISQSVWASAVTPILFYCTGSVVGLWYMLQDWDTSGGTFWDFVRQNQTSYANMFDNGLYFTNVVADFLLPQRVIIFGLILGLWAIERLWAYWTTGKKKPLIAAAVLIGFLPLIHTHSFVALCIFSATLGSIDFTQSLWKTRKEYEKPATRHSPFATLKRWMPFFAILILLALPQLFLIFPDTGKSFLQWQIGWLAKDGNWLLFWLRNLGLYFVLIPAAWIIMIIIERRQHKDRSPPSTFHLLPSTNRHLPLSTFYLGFLAIFIIANLIIFQPWDWDNMKLLVWWLLSSSILVSSAGSVIISKVKIVLTTRHTSHVTHYLSLVTCHLSLVTCYLLLVTCFVSLISTGALTLYRESGTTWPLFTAADQELAAFVQENTPPDALILTSDRHNNPVAALAGRQLFLGYKGWLWSHGLDYSEREREVLTVYRGATEALNILKDRGITHVLADRGADREFFERNLTQIFANADCTLYQVPPLP